MKGIFDTPLEMVLEKVGSISSAVFVLAFAVLALFFLARRKGKTKGEKSLENIHGPKPNPLLGNLLDLPSDVDQMEDFFAELFSEFKKRSKFTVLGQTFVLLYNAADIRAVLHSKNYMQKSDDYSVFKWIGTGSLTASETLWKQTRPTLDIGFRQEMLRSYFTVFCKKSQQLCDILHSESSKDPGPFDIHPKIGSVGFDIIMGTVIGKSSNTLGEEDPNIYSKNIDRAADFFHYLQWRPFFFKTWIGRFLWSLSQDWKELSKNMETLNSFSENILEERKAAFQQNSKEKDVKKATSLLDIMLIEQNKNRSLWNDKQIRDEIDTYLTGGHGATSGTFSLFIQLMAENPEIQEKCYQEISTLLGKEKELKMEDLSKLKYTENCLKECMRLYPGVPLFPREVTRPLTLEDGTKVPVGTTLLLVPFLLHRDEDVFPEAETFIPERWEVSSPHYREKEPYAFIPFSAGPRNCPGKAFAMVEMKVYIAYLISNFRIVKVKDLKDVKVLLRIFIKPKDGIEIRLESRAKQ